MKGISLWYYKSFKKDQLVHAVVYTGDRRVRNYYRIPKGSEIKIANKTFLTNDRDFFLDMDSIPTFTYHINRTDPIDPFDTKKSVMTPEYYDIAINNKVASDIFASTKSKMDVAQVTLFIALFALIGIAAVGYLVYEQSNVINEMREALRILGGV